MTYRKQAASRRNCEPWSPFQVLEGLALKSQVGPVGWIYRASLRISCWSNWSRGHSLHLRQQKKQHRPTIGLLVFDPRGRSLANLPFRPSGLSSIGWSCQDLWVAWKAIRRYCLQSDAHPGRRNSLRPWGFESLFFAGSLIMPLKHSLSYHSGSWLQLQARALSNSWWCCLPHSGPHLAPQSRPRRRGSAVDESAAQGLLLRPLRAGGKIEMYASPLNCGVYSIYCESGR